MNKKNSSVDVPADVLEFIEKESNFLASLYKLNTLDVHNMLEKAVLDFCESLGDKSEFIEFSSSFPELLYSANNVSSLPELLKFSKEIGIIKLMRGFFLLYNFHLTPNLFDFECLKKRTEFTLSYLLENREHIIKTGFPEINPEPLFRFQNNLLNLYYVRTTIKKGLVIDVLTPSLNKKATLIKGLTSDDVKTIEDSRPKLFDLKINIIKEFLTASKHGTACHLWKNCLKLLTESLTADEVDFYLCIDRLYYDYDIKTRKVVRGMRKLLERSGGLTDLLDIIGKYEIRIIIVNMIQAWENSKEDSLKLVSLFDPNDLDKPLKIYFKLLRCSNLKSIDPILDFLNSLRLKELDLLNDHTNRVNEALENEFCVTIPGIKVKRKHVKKYEPQLTSLFESIENHIEATGKMPESTLHVDSPLPKTTDIPTFVFYKNDEHWKIGRKGEKHYSVDHRKCMYYIYILVNYPDVDFFSVDLCNRVEDLIAAEKKGVDNYTTLKTLEADGLLHQFKPPPFIRTNYNHKSGDNEKSRRQKIKNEITELDKKKEKLQLDLEGDALTISPEKVMETKEEIKEIDEQKSERKKYLNSLPKRIDLDPRDPSSQLEKNRIKALKNITTAADILKGFPSVNEYVGEETTRFKTGKRCQYKPSPKKPVEWITNPKDPRLV